MPVPEIDWIRDASFGGCAFSFPARLKKMPARSNPHPAKPPAIFRVIFAPVLEALQQLYGKTNAEQAQVLPELFDSFMG